MVVTSGGASQCATLQYTPSVNGFVEVKQREDLKTGRELEGLDFAVNADGLSTSVNYLAGSEGDMSKITVSNTAANLAVYSGQSCEFFGDIHTNSGDDDPYTNNAPLEVLNFCTRLPQMSRTERRASQKPHFPSMATSST